MALPGTITAHNHWTLPVASPPPAPTRRGLSLEHRGVVAGRVAGLVNGYGLHCIGGVRSPNTPPTFLPPAPLELELRRPEGVPRNEKKVSGGSGLWGKNHIQ